MSPVIREVRSLIGIGQWLLLFPFVFLITFLEAMPRPWRETVENSLGAILLAALCFYAADQIRLTF